ncbi:MAG: light-harvesting protein [Pseudomonadota bacterium]
MNNSRMWLVVSPTVGIPIFLGAVAAGSFAVHVAVLSNTTWVSDFLSGKELGSTETAAVEGNVQTASVPATGALKATTASVSAYDGQRVQIVLPDGSVAEAVIQAPPLDVALKQ